MIIEIFFNFNTAIYQKGNLIMNKRKIIDSYFKNSFPLDILIVVAYFLAIYLK